MNKPYSYDKEADIYSIVVDGNSYWTCPNLMYGRIVDTMFFRDLMRFKQWIDGKGCFVSDFFCVSIKEVTLMVNHTRFNMLLSHYHGCKEYGMAGLLLYQLLHSYFKREDERYTFQVSQEH